MNAAIHGDALRSTARADAIEQRLAAVIGEAMFNLQTEVSGDVLLKAPTKYPCMVPSKSAKETLMPE